MLYHFCIRSTSTCSVFLFALHRYTSPATLFICRCVTYLIRNCMCWSLRFVAIRSSPIQAIFSAIIRGEICSDKVAVICCSSSKKYRDSVTEALILIAARKSNHSPSKVWDEITYLFPNFNGCIVENWDEISNFSPHFIMDVIIHPCCDQSWSMLCDSKSNRLLGYKHATMPVESTPLITPHCLRTWP